MTIVQKFLPSRYGCVTTALFWGAVLSLVVIGARQLSSAEASDHTAAQYD